MPQIATKRETLEHALKTLTLKGFRNKQQARKKSKDKFLASLRLKILH